MVFWINSFFFFSSELIVNRILIVSIVVNKIFFIIIIIIITLFLFFCLCLTIFLQFIHAPCYSCSTSLFPPFLFFNHFPPVYPCSMLLHVTSLLTSFLFLTFLFNYPPAIYPCYPRSTSFLPSVLVLTFFLVTLSW